jgi:predicted RNase H-like HicB family nuclease
MGFAKHFFGLFGRKTQPRHVSSGSVLKVVFCQGEDGFVIAECPQLPGCMSQGRTKEEAARNIRDAIQSVLMLRMGQLLQESPSIGCCPANYKGEESFQINPELTPV